MPSGSPVSFGDALNLLEDAANAIADPNNTSYPAELGRRYCDLLATGPGPIAAGGAALAAVNPTVRRLCGPRWNGKGPQLDVPFQGGQCPVGYRYCHVGTAGNVVCPAVLPGGIPGPITGLDVERTGTTPCNGFDTCGDWRFTFYGPNIPGGSVTDSFTSALVDENPFRGFERYDGLADDCGDPPPDIVVDPTYPNPPKSGPINIEGTEYEVEIGPTIVGPSFGPIVPVTFRPALRPDIDFNIDLDFSGGSPAPQLPGGGQPTEPVAGEPISPSEPGGEITAPELPTESPEFENVPIGIRWELPAVPADRGGVPGTNPLAFYEVAGSLALRYDVGGEAGWTEQVLIQRAAGTVLLPAALEGARVIGVNYNVKPSFGPITLRFLYREVRK